MCFKFIVQTLILSLMAVNTKTGTTIFVVVLLSRNNEARPIGDACTFPYETRSSQLCLFLSLFNVAEVNSVAVVNNFEWMWEEGVVICIMVLPHRLSGGTEENTV
jgi:hypothetical protein